MSDAATAQERYELLRGALDEVEAMLDRAERHPAWREECARHPDLLAARERLLEHVHATRRRAYSLHVHFQGSELTREQLSAFVDLLDREYARAASLIGEAFAILVRLKGASFPSRRANGDERG